MPVKIGRAAGKNGPRTRPRGVGPSATWDQDQQRWTSGEYWFDERAADRAVEFFPRHLRLTTGEWANRPFYLEGWQQDDIIRPLFGWKNTDGTRRYTRCFVWIARKNGKTELAAGIALLLLLGDAEEGGEVYSIARDKDQAAIVFNKATAMVGKSDTLSAELLCLKTAIYCSSLNASFKPLSGTGTGKHGFNVSGLIGDEVHEWKDGELYQFLHDSEGARRQPLEFLISTAGKKGGYGDEVWQECENILDGIKDDPTTLVVVYAADENDDWTDEAVWFKANPNLGVSKKIERMRVDAARAMGSPRLENNFKAYHLNIWTEQAVRWLPIDSMDDSGKRLGWKYCAGPTPWQQYEHMLAGKYCFTGADLSAIADLTSLVHYFPIQDGLDLPHVIARFFKPEQLLKSHSDRDKIDYEQLARDNALFTTPGNVVDYSFFKKTLFDDAERFEIRNIGIDRYNATQTTIEIAQEGLPIEYFQQGFISMSPPSKELERLVMSNAIRHGNHPLLYRHARVVTVAQDPAGNIKPVKNISIQRIDGIVALVQAIGVAINDQPAAKGLTDEIILERGGLV